MNLFKHNCATDGHEFEARYNEEANPIFERAAELSNANRETLIIRKYIKDICVKCGREINKQ